ncbi:unnamed protein product [Prorocentrum cordatum]|uniref:Glycosyltransferase 61 catalytic domain-containing protein n=1 Tax=Prorocentrum cordatum TaxID=2364126 RepID=A0ABN9UJ30_9DINO|nr:unnamed protein product [Polarella glacialis]
MAPASCSTPPGTPPAAGAAAPREASGQWCLGDEDGDLQRSQDRSCRLQNVCYDSGTGGLVFFHGGPPAILGMDKIQGPVYELGPQAVWLRKSRWQGGKPNLEQDVPLQLEYRQGTIPATAQWSPLPYHVLYHTFWASNVGHAWFDDVFPVFHLLHRFGLLDCAGERLKVWQNVPCDFYFRAKSAEDAERACRFQRFAVRALTEEPLETFAEAAPPTPPGLLCMENLLVGTAMLGMQRPPAHVWRPFLQRLLEATNSSHIFPTGQHIVFVHKDGRRAPMNLLDMASRSRQHLAGEAQVTVASPVNLSFKEQFDLARSATVVVTPCGGISFFAAFMAPATTRIIVDYYNHEKNKTGKNDAYIWQWDFQVRTLHYRIERSSVVSDPSDQSPPEGGKNTRVWIDFDQLVGLIRDGMLQARAGYANRWRQGPGAAARSEPPPGRPP